jgi:transcriptional regulator MraZ
MNGLFGQLEKPLDDKGRLVMPSEFRKQLGNKDLVLVRWLDRTLALFPQADWLVNASELHEGLSEAGIYTEDARSMRRLFFSRVKPVTIDKQGRFLIPEDMRRYALLERDAVLLGDWDKVLIWSHSRFAEVEMADDAALNQQYEKTMALIAERRRESGGE